MNNAGIILGVLALGAIGLAVATASGAGAGGTAKPGEVLEAQTIQNYQYRIVKTPPGSPGELLVQVKLAGFGAFDDSTTVGFASSMDTARAMATAKINELLAG